MLDSYVRYLVTSPAGGSIEVSLLKRHVQEDGNERESVAHEAWRRLFDSDRDALGRMRTGADRNNAPAILKRLIEAQGVEKVKKTFTASIQYEVLR